MKRMFRGKKYNTVVRLLDGDEFSTEVTVCNKDEVFVSCLSF